MTTLSAKRLDVSRSLSLPVLPPSAPQWAGLLLEAMRGQHSQFAQILEVLARHRTLVGAMADRPESEGSGVLFIATDTHAMYVDLADGWTELIATATEREALSVASASLSGSGTDPDAIHVDERSEISGITQKFTLTGAEMLVIEDPADANRKKMVTVDNLPGGDGDCPEYKFIKATGQSEGDLHLSDGTSWNTSNALIKKIRIETTSTDWDAWILQNDNGYSTDDANIPAMQIMDAGSGDLDIDLDHAYEDEDTSAEVHLYLIDNSGTATFDVYVIGYGLSTP